MLSIICMLILIVAVPGAGQSNTKTTPVSLDLVPQLGHSDRVHSVSYSDTGERLVTGSADNTLRVWDASTGDLLATLTGHGDAVLVVSYSPDGSYIASGSQDHTLRLWDARTGDLLTTIQAPGVRCLAYSPDGQYIATGDAQGMVSVWSTTTGDMVATFNGHMNSVSSVVYHPDGRLITTASADGTVRMWSTLTYSAIGAIEGSLGKVTSVAYGPAGRRLAIGSADGMIRVWDSVTDSVVATLAAHKLDVVNDDVLSVAYSPDGRHVASGNADGAVRIWDTTTQRIAATLTGYSDRLSFGSEIKRVGILDVEFSPDGRWVAAASADRSVRIWNVRNRDLVATAERHPPIAISALVVDHDGDRVIAATKNNRIWVLSASDGLVQRILRGHWHSVDHLILSEDGKYVVATDSARLRMSVWDVNTGVLVRSVDRRVTSLAYAPDGISVAVGSADGTVQVWNVAMSTVIQTLPGHGPYVDFIAYNSDGKHIVSRARREQTVTMWDLSVGRVVGSFSDPNHDARVAEYSPVDTQVATGGGDGTLRIWDAETGNAIAVLNGYGSAITALAYSPDGQRIASGSFDGTLRLWDIRTHNEIAALEGHTSTISDIAYSPDGRRVASGSVDRTVRVWSTMSADPVLTLEPRPSTETIGGRLRMWNVVDGSELILVEPYKDQVLAVAYSPDGSRIASSTSDGKLLFWDAMTGALQDTRETHKGAVHSVEYSPNGKYLVSASSNDTFMLWDATTHDRIKSFTKIDDSIIQMIGDQNAISTSSGFRSQDRVSTVASSTGLHAIGTQDGKIYVFESESDDREPIFVFHALSLADWITYSPNQSFYLSSAEAVQLIKIRFVGVSCPLIHLIGANDCPLYPLSYYRTLLSQHSSESILYGDLSEIAPRATRFILDAALASVSAFHSGWSVLIIGAIGMFLLVLIFWRYVSRISFIVLNLWYEVNSRREVAKVFEKRHGDSHVEPTLDAGSRESVGGLRVILQPHTIVPVVALVVSGASLFFSIETSTARYKAKQEFNVDIVTIISTLRSIMNKSAIAIRDSSGLDIGYEKEQIERFLSSTTAYGIEVFISCDQAEKRKDPFDAGLTSFFDRAHAILKYYAEDDVKRVHEQANRLWNELSLLTPRELRKIRRYSSRLGEIGNSFECFFETGLRDVLKALAESFGADSDSPQVE